MATRPWVTPTEVKEYTEIKSVQERADNRLAIDIIRAEQYIIKYTNNDFSEYTELPEPVRLATILLAEINAYNSVIFARDKKSETFDDYSYTAETSAKSYDDLELDTLLDSFIKTRSKGNVTMRMTVL